jgi:hypothetical protein
MIPRNELTFDGDFRTHEHAAVVIVNFKLVLQELDSNAPTMTSGKIKTIIKMFRWYIHNQ